VKEVPTGLCGGESVPLRRSHLVGRCLGVRQNHRSADTTPKGNRAEDRKSLSDGVGRGRPPIGVYVAGGQERARLRKRRELPPLPGAPPLSLATMKAMEREATLVLWQRKWAFSPKAQWTRRLVPDVRRWVHRPLPTIPLTFRMTQALTGHGCFQYYIHHMGRATNPLCAQSGSAVDTAEHTLLDCVYWEPFRTELLDRVEQRLSVDTLSSIICGPSEEDLPPDPEQRGSIIEDATESLRLLYKLVEGLLSVKEEEKRARQTTAAVRQNGLPRRRT